MSGGQPTDRRRRMQRDRGAVLSFVALTLPVLLIMTAFAVDLGRQRSSRRTMQARADVVALDLARLADGRTEAEIMTEAPAAMVASAARNHVDPAKLEFEYGTWTESSGFIGTLDEGIPNAVLVTASEEIDYFFQPGTGSTNREAIALASKEPMAGFTVGSRLAAVDTSQSALLNPLLTAILGTNVNLNAADYNNLVGTFVSLSELAVQLGAGSVRSLLDSEVGLRDFYLAQANALELRGDTAAAEVLETIALSVPPGTRIPVGSLADVALGAEEAAAEAGLDVLSLLTTSLFVANGSNAVSIPGLHLGIPNVTDVDVTLSITERPRWVFGPVGSTIDTAQVVLTITPTVGLGLGSGLRLADTELPIRVSVGGARGTLTEIQCSEPQSIDVALNGQAVSTNIGIDLRVLGLLGINVLRIDGDIGLTTLSNPAYNEFSYTTEFLPPVGTGTMFPVAPPDLGLASALSPAKLQSLNVTVLGILPLPIGGILSPLVAGLNPVLGLVDSLLVQPLTKLLGIQLGGGDLGATDLACHPESPTLVG